MLRKHYSYYYWCEFSQTMSKKRITINEFNVKMTHTFLSLSLSGVAIISKRHENHREIDYVIVCVYQKRKRNHLSK
jgi:hypothetical protein